MIGVGDRVVCVESGRTTREGSLYSVIEILPPGEVRYGFRNHTDTLQLRFAEIYYAPLSPSWSCAERFRKIEPDKHEACEDEFVILLKLSKQRVKA